MKFDQELTKGKLLKRYKRFLADVELKDGTIVVAHCANSGSMLGLKDEGSSVWLSPNQNPKAKLDWRWELASQDDIPVGINTSRPNAIVEDAIKDGKIHELAGYKNSKREVKYGKNSRIDILLADENKPDCYVEVKSVTLKRDIPDTAEFPDSVTSRGAKHLEELSDMVKLGHRAVMVYLIQRSDCTKFTIAGDIDPKYLEAFKQAKENGVEAICYDCMVDQKAIELRNSIPIDI